MTDVYGSGTMHRYGVVRHLTLPLPMWIQATPEATGRQEDTDLAENVWGIWELSSASHRPITGSDQTITSRGCSSLFSLRFLFFPDLAVEVCVPRVSPSYGVLNDFGLFSGTESNVSPMAMGRRTRKGDVV